MASILQLRAGIYSEYQIPDFAEAFGITQTIIYDDFQNTGQIDINNTKSDGFTWYVENPPRWQGTNPWTGTASVLNTDYTVSNSILNITSNPSLGGLQFAQRSFSTATPTVPVGSTPLISGAKPFYIEGKLKTGVTANVSLWVENITNVEQSINNSGTVGGTEIDIFETPFTTAATFTIHHWTSSTASSVIQTTRVNDNLWSSSAYGRWGVLVVPRAFNGGTGLVRLYINRTITNVPDYTYSTDTAEIETSNFLIMFSSTTANPISFEYIAASVMP